MEAEVITGPKGLLSWQRDEIAIMFTALLPLRSKREKPFVSFPYGHWPN